MSAKESEAIDRLLEREGIDDEAYLAKSISMTRVDPDEKGALCVEIEGECWHIDKRGSARKQKSTKATPSP